MGAKNIEISPPLNPNFKLNKILIDTDAIHRYLIK